MKTHSARISQRGNIATSWNQGLSAWLDNTSGDHVIHNRVYTFLIVASLLGASDQSRYLDRTAFIPECYPFFLSSCEVSNPRTPLLARTTPSRYPPHTAYGLTPRRKHHGFFMICHALMWRFRRHPDLHHIGVIWQITPLALTLTLRV